MACLGVEPGAAGWKAQTNPLSYGGTPCLKFFNGPSPASFKFIFVLFKQHFTEIMYASAGFKLGSLEY